MPDIICNSVLDIDLNLLKRKGIKYLVIDIDNTIVKWGRFEVEHEIIEWLKKVKMLGFEICLVSNNRKNRVKKIEEILGIPTVYNAKKPLKYGFLKAADILHKGMKNEKTAVIGDQFLTDVLGAKRLKLFAILVKPLDKNEFFVTKINRLVEKFILKYFQLS